MIEFIYHFAAVGTVVTAAIISAAMFCDLVRLATTREEDDGE